MSLAGAGFGDVDIEDMGDDIETEVLMGEGEETRFCCPGRIIGTDEAKGYGIVWCLASFM